MVERCTTRPITVRTPNGANIGLVINDLRSNSQESYSRNDFTVVCVEFVKVS